MIACFQTRQLNRRSGFSLAEVLVTIMIGAMILVSVIAIYARAERTAAAVSRKLSDSWVGSEVFQLIAEDLDKLIAAGTDTTITIKNGFDHFYQTARLEISKTIYDKKNQKQTFEQIIWQASYDFDSDTEGLVLYRSHSGMTLEDKLLDKKRASWEKKYPFIPICSGVTFLEIKVPRSGIFVDKWDGAALPGAVVISISFSEPFETESGGYNVGEAEKITRTIVVDRTRKVRFRIIKTELKVQEEEGDDEIPKTP
ncbi:MAG: PulJ/GspJ family protein, partial [Planctomycetota bacterium]|jgi:prepilin-type N-terminal cleavage/methylation domain-containing protein